VIVFEGVITACGLEAVVAVGRLNEEGKAEIKLKIAGEKIKTRKGNKNNNS
jgi:hypothetical protein